MESNTIRKHKTKDILFSPHILNLGPEPLSKEFNFDYFKKNIKKRKLFLKDLLMNQKFVSGLGNIYVNEILFLSGVRPSREVKKLKNFEIEKIIKYSKIILTSSIKLGGSTIKDFSIENGKKGDVSGSYGKNGGGSKKKGGFVK